MIPAMTMRSVESLFNAACVDLSNYLGEMPWYFILAWPTYKLPSGKVVMLRASGCPGKKVALHFESGWSEEWVKGTVAQKLEVIENWVPMLAAFEAAQDKEYKRVQQALAAVDAYTGRRGETREREDEDNHSPSPPQEK